MLNSSSQINSQTDLKSFLNFFKMSESECLHHMHAWHLWRPDVSDPLAMEYIANVDVCLFAYLSLLHQEIPQGNNY